MEPGTRRVGSGDGSMWGRRGCLTLAAALCCLGLASTGSDGASAVSARRRSSDATRQPSELPDSGRQHGGPAEDRDCSNCSPPLVYQNGAPVMGAPGQAGEITITPIFWGASGAFPSGYAEIINRYLADVAAASGTTDNVYSVSTEYYQEIGGQRSDIRYLIHFGSERFDTNPLPNACRPSNPNAFTSCVTDDQLRTELNSYLANNSLPVDIGHLYPVFFPPGVETVDRNSKTDTGDGCVPDLV